MLASFLFKIKDHRRPQGRRYQQGKVDSIVKARKMEFKVRFTPCSFNISCNRLEFVNVRSLTFVR